jgi:hypothetical protein
MRAGVRERGGGGFRWRRQNVGEVARQNQRRREGDYRLRERERERERELRWRGNEIRKRFTCQRIV